MTEKTFIFDRSPEDTQLMAVLCAEFVRQGVTFKVAGDKIGWEVTLTGGY